MLKLGNTDINALGNNINKAYLGVIEVFGNVFVSLWETTTASETITLPTPTNYRVDWGDGTVTTNTNNHEYLVANQYTIKISGEVTDFRFNNAGDKTKILDVSKYGSFQSGSSAFYGCSFIDVTATDSSRLKPTSLNAMFFNCENMVYNSTISDIDVSLVTDAYSFLRGCKNYNQPINLNTINVQTFFAFLFNAEKFNSPITLNTLNAVSFRNMFANCFLFNQTVNFNTSKAEDMAGMFFKTSFNQPLNFDTSKVEEMQEMFYECISFNQDISHLSFVSVIRMNNFMALKGAEYDVNYMDNLYIKLDQDLVFANMINVNISFGSINYTSAGATARASLVSKGFIITSGIQI